MVSEDDSSRDRELGIRSPSTPDGEQGIKQNPPPAIEQPSRQSQIEWWPFSTARPPLQLKISRTILSLAILLLLGSLVCFFQFIYDTLMEQAHFGQLEGFRASMEDVPRDSGTLTVCLFLLSLLFFALWVVYRLLFKVWQTSQKQ
jgi:hypothetical protein